MRTDTRFRRQTLELDARGSHCVEGRIVNARPYRLEFRDVDGFWLYVASYRNIHNALRRAYLEAAGGDGYFGVRLLFDGTVIVAWSGRTAGETFQAPRGSSRGGPTALMGAGGTTP